MANPLAPYWDWYRLALDCLNVTRRAAGDPALGAAFTSRHATLFTLDAAARQQAVEGAEESLARLAVLDLATVFERALRAHLAQALVGLVPEPSPFLGALRARIATESEWWSFKELVNVYGDVPNDVRMKVKQVIDFRDWVAHGRHTTQPAPTNISPQEAFNRLTDFLTAAGIAT